jgi:hypothetical protein
MPHRWPQYSAHDYYGAARAEGQTHAAVGTFILIKLGEKSTISEFLLAFCCLETFNVLRRKFM